MPINLLPPSGSIGNVPVENIPQFIITLLFVVGMVIAVAFLIFGGIRWILSGGDKTKVEAARGHIVASIIGLVIIAAAFLIFSLVFQILGVRNPLTGGLCIPTLQNPFCFPQGVTPTPSANPTATPSAVITNFPVTTISPATSPTAKPTLTAQQKKAGKATKGGLPLR